MRKTSAISLAVLQILLAPGTHAYAAASALVDPAGRAPVFSSPVGISPVNSVPLDAPSMRTPAALRTALPAAAAARRSRGLSAKPAKAQAARVEPAKAAKPEAEAAARSWSVRFDNAKAEAPEMAPVEIPLAPERQALLNPSQRALAEKLKGELAQRLFFFKRFPISLPKTVFPEGSGPIIDLNDLFKTPNSDEVARIGSSDNGKGPRLSKAQIEEIRRTGTFSVPSLEHPGMSHVWKLGLFFQKGREAIRETLLRHEASSLEQLIVGIPNRTYKDGFFSLRRGFKEGAAAVRDALGLFIGFPESRPRDDVFLEIERARIKNILDKAAPGADTRLYDRRLMEKASDTIYDIERAASAEWEKVSSDVRTSLESALRGEGVPASDLPQVLADRLREIQNERFLEKVGASETLERLGPGLGRLIVDHGRAAILARRAMADLDRETRDFEDKMVEDLAGRFPIRYRIDSWVEEKVQAASRERYARRVWEVAHGLPDRFRENGLAQEAAFLEADLAFDKEIAPGLRARLEAERVPNSVFNLVRIIWNPAKWKIEKRTSPDDLSHYYTLNPLQAISVSSMSPGWRLRNLAVRVWTWTSNAAHWLMFQNLYNGPLGWRSLLGAQPFLFRWDVNQETGALQLTGPARDTLASRVRGFYSQRRSILDEFEKKGNYGLLGKGVRRFFLGFTTELLLGAALPAVVIAGQISLTLVNTLLSTALVLTSWAWAPASAALFWLGQAAVFDAEGTNYGRSKVLRNLPFAGLWGLAALGLGAASFFVPIPAWALWAAPVPLLASLHPRLFPLVRAGAKAVVSGGGNLLGGLVGTMLHAALSLGHISAGGLRTGARTAWDAGMRRLLEARGRVPGGDERFIVRRIAGPGLSWDYFFQVSSDLILVSLQAALEAKALHLYAAGAEDLIRSPRKNFEGVLAAMDSVTGNRSGYDEESPAFAEIGRHEKLQLEDLRKSVQEREGLLQWLLSFRKDQYRPIKLERRDFEPTLKKAVVLCKNFLTKFQEAYGWEADWKQQGLRPGDWEGLARNLLAKLFGEQILTPFEDTDKNLRVEVEAPTLGDIAAAISKGLLPEEVDSVQISRPAGPAGPGSLVPLADTSLLTSTGLLR